MDTFKNSKMTGETIARLLEGGAFLIGLNKFPVEIRRLVLGEGYGHDLQLEINRLQKRLQQLETFQTRARQDGGVFISYSHADESFVNLLVDKLEKDGSNV